jgi:hypothetical protein
MIVIFRFRHGKDPTHLYCCCWEKDYEAHGPHLALTAYSLKGISDDAQEALDDFTFCLEAANKLDEYKLLQQVLNDGQNIIKISEIADLSGSTH